MASWYELSNGISGLLFIVLGVLVARVRAGGASNRAFALFAVAFGAGVFVINLVLPGHPIDPGTTGEAVAMVLDSLLWWVAAAGLVWLAVATRGRGRREGRWVLVSVLVAISHPLLGLTRAVAERSPESALFFVTYQTLFGVMWGLGVLFAHRFMVSSDKEDAGYALMSAALALYPAFFGGLQFANNVWVLGTRDLTFVEASFFLGPSLLVAAVWSGVVWRSTGRRARMARTVVWLCLGAVLAGLLAVRSADGSEHWGYGATRFLAVALLAFAIVRGQAPGIDGRLRFGVSRSAIAGAFVAAFFVVSEGAQIVLGDETPWLGLLAAGALVFVLSPLQRAAQRFAEKAVPGAANPEEIFRQALRLAIRDDGRLSREEELRCAELAESLGIGAGRAAAIMHEIIGDAEAA